jgi:DNA-binding FrmR family transcriptional regulator
MRAEEKKDVLAAVKRMKGLMERFERDVEGEGNCPELLQLTRSLQGHLRQAQELILTSHLHTCAPQGLATPNRRSAFIAEVIQALGLSQR